MDSWEDASDGPHWGVAVEITAPGLTGRYQAYLNLRPGMFTEFDDGFEPVMAATEVARLIAELAVIGNEQAQLDRLGWTVNAVGGDATVAGVVLFLYGKDDIEERQWIVAADGGRFYTLPAYPNWTVGDLPALARLHIGMLRFEALRCGPSDQVFTDDAYLSEAATCAKALGELFGQTAIPALQACRADDAHHRATDLVQAFLDGFGTAAGPPARRRITAHDPLGAWFAAMLAKEVATAADRANQPTLVLYRPDHNGAYYLDDGGLIFVAMTDDGFLDFTTQGVCDDRCEEELRLAQNECRALLSRPAELTAAPERVLVWLADPTNGQGYNAHWYGNPCWECGHQQVYDPHNARPVPCTQPASHAQVTVTRWRGDGSTNATVRLISMTADQLRERYGADALPAAGNPSGTGHPEEPR